MREILLIVPYENIYPPMNGGMQRCFNIINQLAKHFKVSVIINQGKDEFLLATNEFPDIKNVIVYSTKDYSRAIDIFDRLPGRFSGAIRYRWYKKKFSASADGLFLLYYPILVKLLKQNKFDYIILENLATLNAVSIIRKYDPKVKIIYDAHNVDTNLAIEAVKKGELGEKNVKVIKLAESTIYKKVNAVMACSENDRMDILSMNKLKPETIVIPNGVNIPLGYFNEGVLKDIPSHILFCGSAGYRPNLEAMKWFYDFVWPLVKVKYPALKLLWVGSGVIPPELQCLEQDDSVIFTGKVDDLKPWYNKASVAIAPLKTGSGTRLKILEAMGYGVPVVATSKGAEGIICTTGKNIVIADNATHFFEELILLLNAKEKRISIKDEALKLVELHYNWDRIGLLLRSSLVATD